MGDFWAESIHLASPATERFLCLLGQGKSRLLTFLFRPTPFFVNVLYDRPYSRHSVEANLSEIDVIYQGHGIRKIGGHFPLESVFT